MGINSTPCRENNSRLQPLVHPNQLRILNRDLRLVINVVMDTIAPVSRAILRLPWRRRPVDLCNAQRLQVVVAPLILEAVLPEIVDPSPLGRPLPIQRISDLLHARLVAAAVAEENDVEKAVRLVAAADVAQQRLKRGLLDTDWDPVYAMCPDAAGSMLPSGNEFEDRRNAAPSPIARLMSERMPSMS